MTDDLDRLRADLRAAPPPDPDARAAALRLAMENFDRLPHRLPQGTAREARPNSDRPQRAGFWKGLHTMLDTLTARPILATTTSAAALCLGLVFLLPQALTPPNLTTPGVATPDRPQTLALDPVSDPIAAAPNAVAEAVAAPTITAAPIANKTQGRTLSKPAPQAMQDRQAMGDTQLSRSALVMADQITRPDANTESFATAPQNPVHITAENPVSTFSIDVDTASYAIIRSSLMRGDLPPPDAVRIEEMINYFPYSYPAPEPGAAPFTSNISIMPTPWNADTKLVRIGLQGRLPAIADRPPLNLVLLIDTSGSMNQPDKLPLLAQSLRLMLPQLRDTDQVAIIAYAGSAGTVLPPTAASDQATILAAMDRLSATGGTNGAAGLELAYQTAQSMAAAGEVSRVLLATDGDFNLGISDPDGLESYIAKKRDAGVYLSILGFGRGNLDDTTMQTLAQSGNGTAAYIDTLQEARKVLVDQLSGALFPIANDVKLQVEWNPAQVAEYRLIGYETRALAREDFNNDRVDAGEIGAGHAVTALYEITAPNSPALANTPLRYGEAGAAATTDELGFLRLRYKAPGETKSVLVETAIMTGDAETPPDADATFAAAIAGFGQLLTGGKYLGGWGWDAAIALALSARGEDPFGYRAEAVALMRLAAAMPANR
jgi:Ca-activated chloride channel family protein